MPGIEILDLLIRLLADHDSRVADWTKRQQEQERKVDRRAGELLLGRGDLDPWEHMLAKRLAQGEVSRDYPPFAFPVHYFAIQDSGQVAYARPASQIEESPVPRIRDLLQEAIRRAEDERGLLRKNGLPWWVGCDEHTPWKLAVAEVLPRLTCECTEQQLRQYIKSVRDGQVADTNDLSRALALLGGHPAFVENLFGKVRGSYPNLPVETEPLKPTEQEQPYSPPLDRRTGHHRKRLKVDPKARVASWGETELVINKETEFIVLKTLYNAQFEVVAYGTLLGTVKPDTYGSYTTTEAPPEIKPAISRIRKAFKQVGCPYEIQVIKGLGYRLIRWKNSKNQR